jgi:hypothetical protein
MSRSPHAIRAWTCRREPRLADSAAKGGPMIDDRVLRAVSAAAWSMTESEENHD